MAEQEKLEQGKEEPRALTLEEKWQMDEEMQADGSSNHQVFTPQCRSCQFAKKGALEECRKYYTIPWKILTVQEACPYYQSQEDQKQLRYVRIGEKKEILQYICTAEEYRNLGVASDVMKYAEKLFAESGITRMSACIECEEQDLEKPDPGASFFQKIGWKQSSCEWKNLEYQPKHMMSEKWKTFEVEPFKTSDCLKKHKIDASNYGKYYDTKTRKPVETEVLVPVLPVDVR